MTTRQDRTAQLDYPPRSTNLAGKYMGFMLGAESYGLEILKVQEISGLMNITAVPRTPACVRGVINLRGKVIPVIDLRRLFGMKSKADTELNCVMVVQVTLRDTLVTMGLIVDQVCEVMDIEADQIEPPPAFGDGVAEKFLLGIGKFQSNAVLLLDVDRILVDGEMCMIGDMAEES